MTPERVVEWMAERGRTGYRDRIHALEAQINETKGDGGRYWQHCEFTTKRIAAIQAEIEEEKRDALERYEDWASD